MEEDLENKEENDDMERTNHFRQFMFGTNSSSKRKQIDEQEEDFNRHKQGDKIKKRHRGDAWILGINDDPSPKEEEGHANQPKKEDPAFDAIGNFLDQIDLDLLMKSVDSFMTSANELKPIVKKMVPFIKKWMD